MSDIQYVKSVILKQTFLNDSTVVNVNCNNRAWAGNNMHGGFYNAQNLQSVTGINDSVTNTSYTFGECSNLQSVSSLPTNTVTLEACFINCTSLTNAPTIPSSVVSLNTTFYGCTNLTSCGTLPNSVLFMDSTFYNCRQLTTAPNIPDNVLSMGYTFAGCRNLTSAPDAPDYVVNMTGTYGDCIRLTTPPKLSNNVTSLQSTFMFDEALTDIPAIPNSVTNMYQTFLLCTSLGDLANSVNKIGNSVTDMYLTFSKTGITSAPAIPNSVVNMQDTFYMCDNLTSMPTIPNNVTKLAGTFQCCYNLVNITTIPSSVTNMGAGGTDFWPETNSQHVSDSGCFAYCKSLTNIPTIPNSVTDVCGCFSHCYNLTTPTPYALPQSVINAAECFASCNNITQIIIPSAVTNMRDTFNNCTNLTDVYIQSSVVNNVYNCFKATTTTKNIYIPFNTTTYNTFIDAGYDDQGTKEGVYLKNVYILTINPTPADATVTFNTSSAAGNVCAVEPNTPVTYTVSKNGYISKTATVTLTQNQTINVNLEIITDTYINGYLDDNTATFLYKANNKYYDQNYNEINNSAITQDFYNVLVNYKGKISGTSNYRNYVWFLYSIADNTYPEYSFKFKPSYTSSDCVYTKTLQPSGSNQFSSTYSPYVDVYNGADPADYADQPNAIIFEYNINKVQGSITLLKPDITNNNIMDIKYNNKIYRYFNQGIDSNYTYKAYRDLDNNTLYYMTDNISSVKYKTNEHNLFLYNGATGYSDYYRALILNNNYLYITGVFLTSNTPFYLLIREPSSDTNTLPTA